MSCVFLSKSILRCLPHSFLNKLADEFQSKRGGVRRRSQGRTEGGPFKPRRVWIMLKMGQEEEEEKKEEEVVTVPRLSRAPLLPFLSVFPPTEN